ncbi:helix-turn-helix transcriptional regulator [Pseudogracilibacillus sp. SE30717A]|uniref:helix-turn-helix transcriptional regulator n=1 Tax=Pseudogracilibacillus sp. SE30717A TaxID=3098293 RepID=UPI00300E5DC1
MHIGKRIRYIRMKNNLSQEKLAKGIVSVSHLSNLESGRYSASEDTIRFLAKKLKVNDSYLLDCNNPDQNLEKQLSVLFDTILSDVINTSKILTTIQEPINCIHQEWTYFYLKCSYYYKVNELDKAKDLEDSILTYFISDNDNLNEYPQLLKQGYYYYKGISAYRKNNLESSYYFFNMLLETVRHSTSICADMNFNLALTSYQLADYFKAKKHADESIKLYINNGDLENLAIVHNLLGTIYCDTFMFKEALQELEKAMNYSKILKFNSHKARVFHNQGLVYKGMNNLSEALKHFMKSYELKVKIKSESILVTLIEIIECHIILNQYSEAKKLARTSSQYLKTERDYHRLSSLKGSIDLYEDSEAEFIKKKTEALNYFIDNNLFKNAKGIAKELGDFYFKTNKYKNAATYYRMELNNFPNKKGGEEH